MTVTAQTPAVTHLTNGVQVDFSFTFKVLLATDIEVYLNDNNTSEDPATYSIALAGDPPGEDGGTVTMNAAPATGTLSILRNTPRTQEIDFNAYDPFPAEINESGLDKSILIAQEGQEISDRAIVAPPGSAADVDYTAPGYDAGKGWMWSESDPKVITLSNENFNQIVTLATAQADAAAASAAAAATSEANAMAWSLAARTYDFTMDVSGGIANGRIIRSVVARACEYEITNGTAYGVCVTPPSSDTVFTIRCTAGDLCTLTFSNGSNVAAFALVAGADVAIAPGEVIEIVAPGATNGINDVSITCPFRVT